jgi:hypothetical protein
MGVPVDDSIRICVARRLEGIDFHFESFAQLLGGERVPLENEPEVEFESD